MAPLAVFSPQIAAGMVLQAFTRNMALVIDGTVLLVISHAYPPDGTGRWVECRYAGSSEPTQGGLYGMLFPPGAAAGAAPGLMHLCATASDNCACTVPGRAVVHANQWRVRSGDNVVEPWSAELGALGAYVTPAAAADGAGAGAGDDEEDEDDEAEEPKFDKLKALKLKKKLLEKKILKSKSPSDRLKYQTTLSEVSKLIRKRGKGKSSKKKKKSHKSKKKKKKVSESESGSSASSSASASSSEVSDDSALFGVASTRGMAPHGLQKIHVKSPGRLYDQAVQGLARNLGVRGGARNPEAAKMWAKYLADVVKSRATEMPAGRLQEMRTLCAALAKGAKGEFAGLLDILAQRFVGLEARATGKGLVASGLELVEPAGEGLATPGQVRVASRELNRVAKLNANIDRLARRP